METKIFKALLIIVVSTWAMVVINALFWSPPCKSVNEDPDYATAASTNQIINCN